MTFGVHTRVRSKPFVDYLYEFKQLLSVPYGDGQKKNYIGAHLRFRP